jgi:hypothetical protein
MATVSRFKRSSGSPERLQSDDLKKREHLKLIEEAHANTEAACVSSSSASQ